MKKFLSILLVSTMLMFTNNVEAKTLKKQTLVCTTLTSLSEIVELIKKKKNDSANELYSYYYEKSKCFILSRDEKVILKQDDVLGNGLYSKAILVFEEGEFEIYFLKGNLED